MVVNIQDDTTWTFIFDEPKNLSFASFSPRSGGSSRVEIRYNGVLQDVVTSSVPHSWWTPAGNPLYRPITSAPGDKLEVYASQEIDLRVDLE
jgi:hypothetical protein